MQAFPCIFVNVSIVVLCVGLLELVDVAIVDKAFPDDTVIADVPEGSGGQKCGAEVLGDGADKAMVAKETVGVDDICESADVVGSRGKKHRIEVNAEAGIAPHENKGGLQGV